MYIAGAKFANYIASCTLCVSLAQLPLLAINKLGMLIFLGVINDLM